MRKSGLRKVKPLLTRGECTLAGLRRWAADVVTGRYADVKPLNYCNAVVYEAQSVRRENGEILKAYVMVSYLTPYAVAVTDESGDFAEVYNFGDNSGYKGSVISKSHVAKWVRNLQVRMVATNIYHLYPHTMYRKREYEVLSGDDFKMFLTGTLIYEYAERMESAH